MSYPKLPVPPRVGCVSCVAPWGAAGLLCDGTPEAFSSAMLQLLLRCGACGPAGLLLCRMFSGTQEPERCGPVDMDKQVLLLTGTWG